jgi:hypothetical protein
MHFNDFIISGGGNNGCKGGQSLVSHQAILDVGPAGSYSYSDAEQ